MSIFDRFRNKNPSKTRFELISDKGNGFYSWNGNLYKSDVIRACIRPTVRAVGKLIPQHITKKDFQLIQNHICVFYWKNLIHICVDKCF